MQAAAEPLLDELGHEVMQLARDSVAIQAEPVHNTNTQSPTQTTSREEAVTDDVHERNRIPDSEPELAESQENQPEPVRQDAAGLLGAERAEPVRPDDAGGNAAAELSQDGAGRTADGGQDAARPDAESADARPQDERQSQLHYDFSEVSASVAGIYVKASEDFSVTMTYTDATQTLMKTVHVTLDDSAPVPGILHDRFAQETQVAMCSADEGIATYAGLQVTQCVNTSVGWMNYLGGQPALCGDRGKWAWGPGATYKNKYPPVANYTPAGQVWVEAEYFNKGWVPDQATLWSKGFNNGAPAVASLALDAADNATDNYLALLSWQAEQYPDSIAAEIVNAPEAYAAPTGKTVYVGTLYTPSNAAWQRFVVLNYTPVVLSGDSEIPGFETGGESVDKPWSASYERSESLDFSYTVNTDKIQLDTLEKVDGAGIEIAPILDGIPADIDGGSWTITPDGMQSVTTSGHTADDNYHLNGGDGSVTWTVHFSVSNDMDEYIVEEKYFNHETLGQLTIRKLGKWYLRLRLSSRMLSPLPVASCCCLVR